MTGLIPYTLGIPAANNNPSNDQPLMKVNNDNNSAIWAVDHVTFGANYSGTHISVTFENSQSTPTPPVSATQIYPQTFGGAPSLLETYCAVTMSNGQTIYGLTPIVKAIATFTTVSSGFPASLATPANCLTRNIASVIQTASNSVTVTFTTALAYNLYYVFEDATNSFTTVTKNTTSVVLGVLPAKTYGFMVI